MTTTHGQYRANVVKLNMRAAVIAALLVAAPASASAQGCSDRGSTAQHRVGQLLQALIPEQQVVRINSSSVVDTIGIAQTCYFVTKGSVRLRQRNSVEKDQGFTLRIQYDAGAGKWTGSDLKLFFEF